MGKKIKKMAVGRMAMNIRRGDIILVDGFQAVVILIDKGNHHNSSWKFTCILLKDNSSKSLVVADGFSHVTKIVDAK